MAFLFPLLAFSAEPLKCGFAVSDITPPVGYRMSGYFYERFSTGVANPLLAKAVVLQQGDQRLAWVFCDLVGVPAHVTTLVREQASKESNIPRDNLFIAATHTHTGPLYFGPLRNYFHSAAVKKNGADTHEAVDYGDELREKLVATVAQAAAALEFTDMALGTTQQQGLSFNRRYVLRDGSVRTNPGKANPNIVRPAGPIDPDVGLIQFRRDDQPVAGLTIFALHLDTSGGTDFAADFPFHLAESLREEFGSQYLSLFGIGTCGDINHFDLMNNRGEKGIQESKRIGQTLAATVKAGVDELPVVEHPQLAAASTTLQVPLQQYTESEMAAARENLSKVGSGQMPMLEQVAAVKIVGIDELDSEKLPMEVQAFRLSKTAALVALPGELFVELGLSIKQRSPFATTFVVELCNDYPGYVPTKRGFAEGSYEPTNSKLAPGGGEMLADAAIELLNKLHAE
jgi:hypothetical protein